MATADQTMGLFTTPEQYQQAQLQQILANRASQAQMTPEQQAQFALGTGIDRAAQGIGGFMGIQDPQMQLQAQRRALIQQVDMSSPDSLVQAIKASSNDPELNAFLMNKYKELETVHKTQAETTAKLREAVPTAVREYQLAKAQGYTGNFMDYQTALKKAGATNVSLSATADKSYGSQFGEGVAKSDLALRDAANAAPEILSSIERTRSLLDSGKVFTGTGANAKLNLLAFGQALGVTGANDNEVVANTQQLQQQRSKAVLSQIKASGLGTGQGFTDKDLAFLEKASAGTITLSPATIREQLKIEEKVAKASANQWNKRVSSLPQSLTSSMGLTPVQTPTTTGKPSAGIPLTGVPLVDKYLTNP